MRSSLGIAFLAAFCGVSTVHASDLGVTLEADGCESSTIAVGPGCDVVYSVFGELGDTANQGLAVIVFDLKFDGGTLPQANEPTELPMLNFVPPFGFSGNPSGYGGTPQGGNLIQVGGAQNVFNHGNWQCDEDDDCPAPSICDTGLCTLIPGLPNGTLVTDVAAPGAPVVLVTGTFTAPGGEGTYTLQVTNVKANLVSQGATGNPVWVTEEADIGPITDLSVTVQDGALCCGEIREACCLPGGTCISVDPDECASTMGGTPVGPDTTCEDDSDGDGLDGTCGDECPDDPDKILPGPCGCGTPDTDSDDDTVPDCVDQCPDQDDRVDINLNGVPDCLEEMPIPTLTEWGLVILALSLLAVSRVCFGRRLQPVTVRQRM